MTIKNFTKPNPQNPNEKFLAGNQMTKELEAHLIIAARFLGVEDSSSKAIPIMSFCEHYEEFGNQPIIPNEVLKEAGRYISHFNGTRYELNLQVYDWETVNRVRSVEKVQNGLEVLMASYFYIQDFISYLNKGESVFDFPNVEYASSQLRQRGDEDSLYLADFFQTKKLVFPNPNYGE